MSDAVEKDRLADDPRVAAIAPLPETVAQHDNVGAARPVLARRESPSECRFDFEDVEHVRGEVARHDLLGAFMAGDVLDAVVVSREGVEGAGTLFPVLELRQGETGAVPPVNRVDLPELHELVGMAEGKLPNQIGIHEAEDQAVGGDAERQGRHDDERVARVGAERAERQNHVLSKLVESHKDIDGSSARWVQEMITVF